MLKSIGIKQRSKSHVAAQPPEKCHSYIKYIMSISRDIILNRIIAQKEVMYNCTCIYSMVLEKYSLEPSGNAGT